MEIRAVPPWRVLATTPTRLKRLAMLGTTGAGAANAARAMVPLSPKALARWVGSALVATAPGADCGAVAGRLAGHFNAQ